jgi:hypothetical protein
LALGPRQGRRHDELPAARRRQGIDPGNHGPVSFEEYAKWLDSRYSERRGLNDLLPDAEYNARYWAARAATEEAVAVDLADRWIRSKLAYAHVERIYLEQNGLDATIEWENSHGATFTRPTIEGASDIDTSPPRRFGTDAGVERARHRRQIEALTRAIEQLRAAGSPAHTTSTRWCSGPPTVTS